MSRQLNVFIASPNDVQVERQYTLNAISALSDKLQSLYDVVLAPVHWKQFAPVAAPSSTEPFQERIMTRLDVCPIFIGILYRRYGTAIPLRGGVSGTEQEFRYAIEHRARMKLLTYFREQGGDMSLDHEADTQLLDVNKLKRDIVSEGLPWTPYHRPTDFKQVILLDLMEVAISILTDAPRREAMRRFFYFDGNRRRDEPSVMIGYPASHKHHGDSAQPNYDWRQRLVPNVIYEDFKAIQKIEAALAAIGVRDYASVTTDHPALTTASSGHRIWLCVPRNEPAQLRLESLGDRARFRFTGVDSESRTIKWRRLDGSMVAIRSPLAFYLRQRPAGRTQWRPPFGQILAKDYAVVARFRSSDAGFDCFDYFFAGIRGLGTWGCGWYIDRHPEQLAELVRVQCPMDERGDVQTVLEVEYRNYRIQKVVDVSDRDQSYFDEEMTVASQYSARQVAERGVRRSRD